MRCLVVLALLGVLSGCGTQEAGPPANQPSSTSASVPSTTTTTTTTTSTTTTTTSTTTPPPPPPDPASVTTKVKDCFDGDCALAVTKAVKIPLDAARFYYPAVSVVSVSPESVTYQVDPPHGGRLQSSVGIGGGGAFGFRDYTHVQVRFAAVGGRSVFILSPKAPS